ncbi:MAG: PEP/pyruvate-binding domain-containing protein, partial [Gammaproteobacteria bacterium]
MLIKESSIRWFKEIGMKDVAVVGGKNASLGEMIGQLSDAGIRVPDGFATTAQAFRDFLELGGLESRINTRLAALDIDDVKALAQAGTDIRSWILANPLPEPLENEIRHHYAALGDDVSVAVRSSATAEDLPEASFAGQQESFLNVCGVDHVLAAVHDVFASLFNDRAIAYRVHQGFT